MLEDAIRWRRVQDPRVMALKEGVLLRVKIKDRAICFARINGTLRALTDVCPHQGKSFEGGTCEDGYIVCPWHRMNFDPVTGHNRFGLTSNAEVFALEERADGIWIGLPGTSFSLFGIKLW